MNIIVSVLSIGKRVNFILAAHPSFIPEKESSNILDMFPPAKLYHAGYADEWDCLWHPGKIDMHNIGDAIEDGLPDISRDGFFIESPYAEAAHFLTVQKMLSRFDKVCYYMSPEPALYQVALCALAGPIRDGGADIVLFRHDIEKKKENPRAGFRNNTRGALRTKLANRQQELDKRLELRLKVARAELSKAPDDDQLRAGLLNLAALQSGYSEQHDWGWLQYPPNGKAYRDCRSLWLTRRPGQTFDEDGFELMSGATLWPVDFIIDDMRKRVRCLSMASAQDEDSDRGEKEHSYFRPEMALSELWVYLMYRNYRRRAVSVQAYIPAHVAGLMTDKEADETMYRSVNEEMVSAVTGFRLGVQQARTLTRWCS